MKIKLFLILFINLFCISLLPQSESKFSGYQGYLIWKDAKAKCDSIGMRLPTKSELKKAFEARITESWKSGNYVIFWTSDEYSDDSAYFFAVTTGNAVVTSKSREYLVRCIQDSKFVEAKETEPVKTESIPNLFVSKFSKYQGKMNWDDAQGKCASIGMKVPTREELKKAYSLKVMEDWEKDGLGYWSSEESVKGYAYIFVVEDGGVYGYGNKGDLRNLRCIR